MLLNNFQNNFMSQYVCVCVPNVWRSEGNLWKLALPFPMWNPGVSLRL